MMNSESRKRLSETHSAEFDARRLAEQLRGLARDPHARAVLSKAFREAPMANAAEALHALADGLDAGSITGGLPPVERPCCLRCEVPIYQDGDGIWRREATGSQVCPRNPAVDGHEPIPTYVKPPGGDVS